MYLHCKNNIANTVKLCKFECKAAISDSILLVIVKYLNDIRKFLFNLFDKTLP